MSDLTLHLIAQRLPDQLLTVLVPPDQIPADADTDETHERMLSDGTLASIIVHWQPATPAPNAIERATLLEVIARLDIPVVAAAPTETPSTDAPHDEDV